MGLFRHRQWWASGPEGWGWGQARAKKAGSELMKTLADSDLYWGLGGLSPRYPRISLEGLGVGSAGHGSVEHRPQPRVLGAPAEAFLGRLRLAGQAQGGPNAPILLQLAASLWPAVSNSR